MKNCWCLECCGQLQSEVVEDQDLQSKGKAGGGRGRWQFLSGKEFLSHSSKGPLCFVTQSPRLGLRTKQTALGNSEGDLLKRTLTEEL